MIEPQTPLHNRHPPHASRRALHSIHPIDPFRFAPPLLVHAGFCIPVEASAAFLMQNEELTQLPLWFAQEHIRRGKQLGGVCHAQW